MELDVRGVQRFCTANGVIERLCYLP
jgi:hypothetical protein